MKKNINISQDDFYTYEVIRVSGLVNMFDIKQVIDLSLVVDHKLNKDSIIEIQSHYIKYLDIYPLPTNGIIKIRADSLRTDVGEA
jgi:hypothetical protein